MPVMPIVSGGRRYTEKPRKWRGIRLQWDLGRPWHAATEVKRRTETT